MGKPHWRQGIEIPEFSGKSWKTLNDVWPVSMRTTSEAYYILCGFLPAFMALRPILIEITGKQKFDLRDVMLLAWISRCEEAKEGLCTEIYPIHKGLNLDIRMIWRRKASLTKFGFIENIPTGEMVKAYRITDKGRIVLHKFVSLIDEVHTQLREVWSKDVPGSKYDGFKNIDHWIRRSTGDDQKLPEEKKDSSFEIID